MSLSFCCTESLPYRGRWAGLFCAVALCFSAIAVCAQDAGQAERKQSPAVITRLEQMWQMTDAESKDQYPLRIEYVVYYYDPLWNALWGRCGETDSYFAINGKALPIKPRQRILIESHIVPASGLRVTDPKITVLEENVAVEVLPTGGDIGNIQRFNKRLVTVEGFVDRQAARDGNHHQLELIVEGQSVLTEFLVGNGETVPQLKGSVVRVEGVYFSRNDSGGSASKLEIWVPGLSSIEVLGQLDREGRFNLPATPINQLGTATPDRLVRVVGTVEAQDPGKFLTLRDETGRVTLVTAQTQPVAVDDQVEVIGYPLRLAEQWSLRESLYRRAQRTLTKLDSFWQIPESEQNDVNRVKMEFVVYYFDPFWKAFWGNCGGVGGYLTLGEQHFPIKPGQRILVEGQVVKAQGTKIENARVSLLEASVPMEILSTRGQVGNTERFNKRLTSVEGYVDRQIQTDPNHLELDLVAEGRAVTVRLLLPEAKNQTNMEGALIEVKGLYSATIDSSAPQPKIEIWVQSLQDVEIKGSLDQDKQFKIPGTAVDSLPAAAPGKLVRVVGTVRVQRPGKSLTIRDETGQLILQTAQMQAMELGEQIEAVGYPELVGTEWQLRDALFRRSGAAPLAPTLVKRSLRLAEQLRELSSEDAANGYPVQLSGIVTWASSSADFFFLRDVSGGVCVFQPAQKNNEIVIGSKITLSGVSASGKFTPVVLASSVEVAATMDLPEPKQVTLEQALTGIEEAQWVTMSGYVRGVTHDGPWARLELTTSAGEFEALLPWADHLNKLRHSVVRLRGVCNALTNGKRQLIGIQVWVGSELFLEIEEAEPADPFSVVEQSISSLRQFNSLQTSNRRVRIAGVVVHHAPGVRVLIQEGTEGLLVLSRDSAVLQPGDRIEAVGFLGRENGRTVLREAVYRRLASGAEPAPLNINSLNPVNVELDGRLVRIQAGLLEMGAQEKGTRLIMQSGDTIFEALLDAWKSTVPDNWIAGSKLILTGVYQVQFDEYKRPHAVRLQLRTLRDVNILTPAPWWTVGRALAVTGVLTIAILLGFGWVIALRRRVQLQTGQIREQVESEKAARLEVALARASKLESLGVLAGGIAHDFNNLLTVVMGNLSLAKLDPRIESETLECLQESERAAQRARDLTQQLITFAKGGEPVRTITVLPDVVREATKFALHGSKVRSDYDFAPDLWRADIDKGQIGQVVHNIIINATHAMAAGGVVKISLRNDEVRSGFRPSLAPGNYLHLTIADTGTGIEPEHLARIFDPYFTTKEKGSGLGLASVYSIIKKHRGHIEVQSKVGEGTTFHIWLPASVAAPVTVAPSEPAPKPHAPQTARVLLMDDEPSIRLLGGAILKRLGLEHTAVPNGTAVLREYEAARAEGRPYDLVMLDLTVPGGMGGAEAMEKLLKLDPKVKAIVSSGYSHDPVMANYRAYGFLGVIPKPYVMAEFVKTIDPMLPHGLGPSDWR